MAKDKDAAGVGTRAAAEFAPYYLDRAFNAVPRSECEGGKCHQPQEVLNGTPTPDQHDEWGFAVNSIVPGLIVSGFDPALQSSVEEVARGEDAVGVGTCDVPEYIANGGAL